MVLIFIFIRNKYSFPCWCYVFRSYGAQICSVYLFLCVEVVTLINQDMRNTDAMSSFDDTVPDRGADP